MPVSGATPGSWAHKRLAARFGPFPLRYLRPQRPAGGKDVPPKGQSAGTAKYTPQGNPPAGTDHPSRGMRFCDAGGGRAWRAARETGADARETRGETRTSDVVLSFPIDILPLARYTFNRNVRQARGKRNRGAIPRQSRCCNERRRFRVPLGAFRAPEKASRRAIAPSQKTLPPAGTAVPGPGTALPRQSHSGFAMRRAPPGKRGACLVPIKITEGFAA